MDARDVNRPNYRHMKGKLVNIPERCSLCIYFQKNTVDRRSPIGTCWPKHAHPTTVHNRGLCDKFIKGYHHWHDSTERDVLERKKWDQIRELPIEEQF